jgi:hypothetical protein
MEGSALARLVCETQIQRVSTSGSVPDIPSALAKTPQDRYLLAPELGRGAYPGLAR